MLYSSQDSLLFFSYKRHTIRYVTFKQRIQMNSHDTVKTQIFEITAQIFLCALKIFTEENTYLLLNLFQVSVVLTGGFIVIARKQVQAASSAVVDWMVPILFSTNFQYLDITKVILDVQECSYFRANLIISTTRQSCMLKPK